MLQLTVQPSYKCRRWLPGYLTLTDKEMPTRGNLQLGSPHTAQGAISGDGRKEGVEKAV